MNTSAVVLLTCAMLAKCIARYLLSIKEPEITGKVILAGRDIEPSVIEELPADKIAGIILGVNSVSAYAVIIAKAHAIPTIIGVGDGIANIANGDLVILDDKIGEVLIRSSDEKREKSSGGKSMKDYVAEFQKKIAEINDDAQKVNIINAGVMNHGKSSLFNSLINKDVFPEEDIRTTVKIQVEQWSNKACLIDTPGLSAEIVDDVVAYEAYRRANVILFVHRVDTGEIHKNGIDGLNKIKSLFHDEKFFTEHFCLVLTSIDEQNASKNLSTIIGKIRADVENNCGLSGFKIFSVSNPRYRKGMAENKPKLVEMSGIPELREYLQQNFDKWLGENKAVRAVRITREKEDFLAQLQQERGYIQTCIQSKTEQIKQRQRNFLDEVEAAVALRMEDLSKYEKESKTLKDMRDNLKDLRDRWNRERY